jgi:hypothetical protein
MTRVNQCPISLRAEHPMYTHEIRICQRKNRKLYDKNRDNTCVNLKLTQKRKWEVNKRMLAVSNGPSRVGAATSHQGTEADPIFRNSVFRTPDVGQSPQIQYTQKRKCVLNLE